MDQRRIGRASLDVGCRLFRTARSAKAMAPRLTALLRVRDVKSLPDWRAIASDNTHRPWPRPRRPWIFTMSWLDLLFAHWEVSVDLVRSKLPRALDVDTFEDQAWLGVVPFRMKNVGPRGLSRLPFVSSFAELNVRTYVRDREGRSGVWFFSLDASNPLAVAVARAMFHLPYFNARMGCRRSESGLEYESVRSHRGFPSGAFVARYRSSGQEISASRGSLEHWLTERYCLYSADSKGRIYRGEIQHRPWALRSAAVEIETNTVAEAHGFVLAGPPTLTHFVERQDVVGWSLDRVG